MKSVLRFTLALTAILSCVSEGRAQTPAGTKVRKPQMSDTEGGKKGTNRK